LSLIVQTLLSDVVIESAATSVTLPPLSTLASGVNSEVSTSWPWVSAVSEGTSPCFGSPIPMLITASDAGGPAGAAGCVPQPATPAASATPTVA
jgi:hypothetical protein